MCQHGSRFSYPCFISQKILLKQLSITFNRASLNINWIVISFLKRITKITVFNSVYWWLMPSYPVKEATENATSQIKTNWLSSAKSLLTWEKISAWSPDTFYNIYHELFCVCASPRGSGSAAWTCFLEYFLLITSNRDTQVITFCLLNVLWF